jgi:hypothetical protein
MRPPGVALCYSDLATGHPATAAFWNALRGGDVEARAASIASLQAAAAAHPKEEQLALLHGLAHLWRLAEPLPAEAGNLGVMLDSATTARQELERAYRLCPTDHRIPAWLGPILVRTGEAVGQQATIEEGLTVLQRGIDHYPAFVLFSKLLVYAGRPKNDPEFEKALSAVEQNIDLCMPSDPACSNHANAAHNVEGGLLFIGDVMAKAGKRSRALGFYEMARTAPDFPTWPFQGLITSRIASIDSRMAAYDTPAATDDPEAAWTSATQCSVCHRK